ncbi:MAG TPA: hypothetical protein VMT20_15140 [Terriglobia bacterium]|nr:hypothetical protein [Terriglobia bacterium]
MQRNSPERKAMLAARRSEQLDRDGGDKRVPVVSAPSRSKRGQLNSSIIKLGGKRYHATKGKRPPTAYEKLIGIS